MTETQTTAVAHLAIIPDGNRRWARTNGKTLVEGHRAAYRNLRDIADAALERGVRHLTVYAFSTENWNRPPEEVDYLMKLLNWVLDNEVAEFHKKGIRLNFYGSRDGVAEKLLNKIDQARELTKDNDRGTLNMCFNYGGRADLVAAARQLVADGLKPDEIDEDSIAARLSSVGQPEPELIIRTSGEKRLSNFLLWESAYSELYFSDKLWPDFNEDDLQAALDDYAKRQRRYGG